MMTWLRRLGTWTLLVLSSVLCWALATRFWRKGEGSTPRVPLREKAEAIRTACQQELQRISGRLDQAQNEIQRTQDIPDEKARLQALADLANRRSSGGSEGQKR